MFGGFGSLNQAVLQSHQEERAKKYQEAQNQREREERKKERERERERERKSHIPLNAAETDDIHAIMAKKLPQQVIIQSGQLDNRYLHFYQQHPVLPNALRFYGDYSFERETRFEVEPATTGAGHVHIRCLKNKKYWANFGTGNNWVSAMADKPVEDQSDEHCTLFQPIFLYSNNSSILRLRHVHTGSFVKFYNGSGDAFALLCLMPGSNDGRDVCTFIDWESVVVLPDLIRIKGDNGNHLKAGDDGFMDFNSVADNSSAFDFEVSPSRNGGIRLRSSLYSDKYWTDADESKWVQLKPAASTTVHEINTVFFPTIVDGNRIILRCLKSDYICKRHNTDERTNCLATLLEYPDDFSYMEIEEPYFSRKIENVKYDLTEVRRYNETTFALITDETTNKLNAPMISALNLKTVVTNSKNWTANVSLKLGGKIEFTAGIPKIAENKAEIHAEIGASYTWGHADTKNQEVGSVKTVTVKPKTRMKGTLMGTRLSYDIPYSYTQRDELKNGRKKVTEKHDGLFTGNDGYGYDFVVQEFDL